MQILEASVGGTGWPDAPWEPEVIADGLWRLRTPMTSEALPWVYAYAFVTADGIALYDSGHGTERAQSALESQLSKLGFNMSDVHTLMISHAHPDHLGMASWIKQQSPKCDIAMMAREAKWYSDSSRGSADWVQQNNHWMVRHGISKSEIAEGFSTGTNSDRSSADGRDNSWFSKRINADILLADGQKIDVSGWELQAHWTPGHTPGHLCVEILDKSMVLTGDHILGRITPNVSLSPEDEEADRNPLGEFLDSLIKIRDLGRNRGLPAHENLIDDLSERCDELLDHHEKRCEEVMAGIGESNSATAAMISSRVTWNKPFEGFSIFKKRMALGETIAHLKYLSDIGKVSSFTDASENVIWRRI